MENELRIRIERCFKLGRRYFKENNSDYNLKKFIEAEEVISEINSEVGTAMSNINYIYFNENITLEQVYQVIDILLGTHLYETHK